MKGSIVNRICRFAAALCLGSALLSYLAMHAATEDTLWAWTEDTQQLMAQTIAQTVDQTLLEVVALAESVQSFEAFQGLANRPPPSAFQSARDQLALSEAISSVYARDHGISGIAIAYTWGSQFIPGSDVYSVNLTNAYPQYRQYAALAAQYSTGRDSESGIPYHLSDAGSDGTRRIAFTVTAFPSFQDTASAFITVIIDADRFTAPGDTATSIRITDGAGAGFALLDGASEREVRMPLHMAGWEVVCGFGAQSGRWGIAPLMLLLACGYGAFGYFMTRRLMRPRFSALLEMEGLLDEYESTGSPRVSPVRAHRLTLGQCLVLWYAAFVFLPIVVSAGALAGASGGALHGNIMGAYRSSVDLIARQVDGEFEGYQAALEEFSLDAVTQRMLAESGDEALFLELDRSFLAFSSRHNRLAGVSLIAGERAYAFSGASALFNTADAQMLKDHAAILRDYGRRDMRYIPLSTEEEGLIRMGMLVIGSHGGDAFLGKRLGTAWLYFSDTTVRSLLKALEENELSYALCDSDGAALIGQIDERENAAHIQTSLLQNWSLQVWIPNHAIAGQINRFIVRVVGILSLLFSVFMVFVLIIRRQLTRSIHRLLRAMEAAEAGDLSARYEGGPPKDEIDRLGYRFQEMLSRLNAAVAQKMDYEKRMHDFEMNLLQAQVHPHFLYNTLRTVQVMIVQKNERAVDVIDKLIRLFRASANVHIKEITLGEELHNLHAYLDIQTIRFAGRFRYEESVPEPLHKARIIRFVLQPLLENAILHGFENRAEGGIIRLTARAADGELFIEMEDNGEGMTDQQIALLMKKLEESHFDAHIGLLNVHHRVRLHCGDEYGLLLKKSDMGGLSILLRFPLIQ